MKKEKHGKEKSIFKHSAFWITINTNKDSRKFLELPYELEKALTEMFEPEGLLQILKEIDNETKDLVEIINFEESKATFVIETIGNRSERVGAHALLAVKHTGKLHIDIEELKEFIRERIKSVHLKGFYVNIQAKGYTTNVKQYMQKYLALEKKK